MRTAGLGSIGRFSLRRIATETYYRWIAHRASTHFALPDGLLSMPGTKTAALLQAVARSGVPHEVLEIPCHPATTTDGLWGTTLMQDRVDEYDCLVSDEFQDAVHSGRIELLNFSDLTENGERGKHGKLAAATV